MLYDKKGQGLSMNVIIIAAIALLILVILSTLVLKSFKTVNDETSACLDIGGTCEPAGACPGNSAHQRGRDSGCDIDSDEWCCVPV